MDCSVFTCISAEPLDLNHYANLVADPAVGAISTFSGVTRNNFGGKAVLRLEYEAYIPMAIKKLDVRGRLQQQAWLRMGLTNWLLGVWMAWHGAPASCASCLLACACMAPFRA